LKLLRIFVVSTLVSSARYTTGDTMSESPSTDNARRAAIEHAFALYDSGRFQTDLARRVGFRTESQEAAQADALHAYRVDEVWPALGSRVL